MTAYARITSMCGEIDGVKTAYDEIPRVLQDADLPAFVVFPGEAVYDLEALGEQMVVERANYDLVLYVANAAFGITGELQIRTSVFLTSVRDYFVGRPGLELDAEYPAQAESVYRARLVSRGALAVGPYPINQPGQTPTDYIQYRWRLAVEEVAAVAYQD